jgi:hypothetical protein
MAHVPCAQVDPKADLGPKAEVGLKAEVGPSGANVSRCFFLAPVEMDKFKRESVRDHPQYNSY